MITERKCDPCDGTGTSNGLSACPWCDGEGQHLDSEHTLVTSRMVSFDGQVRVTGAKLRELAAVAFRSYLSSKTPKSGRMPEFDELPREEQTAWVWAVDAMLARVLSDIDATG